MRSSMAIVSQFRNPVVVEIAYDSTLSGTMGSIGMPPLISWMMDCGSSSPLLGVPLDPAICSRLFLLLRLET